MKRSEINPECTQPCESSDPAKPSPGQSEPSKLGHLDDLRLAREALESRDAAERVFVRLCPRVRQRVDALAPGGGYILCTAHNIQADTTLANFEALMSAYREYGTYR